MDKENIFISSAIQIIRERKYVKYLCFGWFATAWQILKVDMEKIACYMLNKFSADKNQ